MVQVHYCYVIHRDAETAYDAITGEAKESYFKVSFNLFNDVPAEKYKYQHEVELIKIFSKHRGIRPSHIKPISYEEYLKNSSGEDYL